jgi:tol-pal system protein YbgF
MHFRTILSGTLAVLLVSTATATPGYAGQGSEPDSGFSFHLPTLGVFGGSKERETQTQIAQQSGGVGMTGLEDQIRQMNGKIEELNFQILQMQEQIRKQQEDNEFRFQQLEGSGGQGTQKKSDAGSTPDRSVAQAPAAQPDGGADQTASAQPSGQNAAGQDSTDQIGEVIIDSGNGEPGKVIQGTPPKNFGTITVDKNGNVVDAGQSATAAVPAPGAAPAAKSNDTVVAALPPTDNADELYRNSYQFILSGDYPTAEQGFRDHIARFPKSAKAADAHYWLGEALLGQQKYRDAAEIFLAASKDYPKAKKAPDMLLKLGVSLVGLHQRDVACATFSEVGKRYPDISSALKERVKQEQALASC